MAISLLACSTSKPVTMHTTDDNQAKTDAGFVSLLGDNAAENWHSYGKTTMGKAWKVTNGVLHLDAASKKDWQTEEGGDIVSNEEYEDFDLKLDWKIAAKGNSGIMFYVIEDTTKYKYPWNTGPEYQVLDNGTPTTLGHPDGKLYTHRAGDLYDLLASKEAVKPAGEWNAAEIVVNKGKLDFYLNGQHTLSTTLWDENWKKMIGISKFKDMPGFGSFKKGRIALQDHGNDVWFRNIQIKKM